MLNPAFAFYILVFLSIFAPHELLGAVKIGPFLLTISELAGLAILPIWAILPKVRNYQPIDSLTRLSLYLFLGGTLLSFLYHAEASFVRVTLRMFFPFSLAAMLICYPPTVDRKHLSIAICLSITTSFLIACFMYFSGAEYTIEHRDREIEISALTEQARFHFRNASFGVFGMFLFLLPSSRIKHRIFQYTLSLLAALSGMLGLIMSFNRTYLGLIVLHGLCLQWLFRRDIAGPLKAIAILLAAIAFASYFYETNDRIRRQVDTRIIAIFDMTLDEAYNSLVVEGGREQIWTHAFDAIAENWMFGMSSDVPIFWNSSYEREVAIFSIDNPSATVWIRAGILPALSFTSFWVVFATSIYYRGQVAGNESYRQLWHGFFVCVVIHLLASFNMNSVLNHATVLHIAILYVILRSEDGASND